MSSRCGQKDCEFCVKDIALGAFTSGPRPLLFDPHYPASRSRLANGAAPSDQPRHTSGPPRILRGTPVVELASHIGLC